MHKLLIKVNHPKLTLFLENDGQVVEEFSWQDQNSLSVSLLDNIDKFLAKNGLTVKDLEKVEVDSDQKAYTSTRIAKAVAKTINFGLEPYKK